MSLSEATLKKLSKYEAINLLLDCQNKFDTNLTRTNTDLSDLISGHSGLKQNILNWSQNLVLLGKSIINFLVIVSWERHC